MGGGPAFFACAAANLRPKALDSTLPVRLTAAAPLENARRSEKPPVLVTRTSVSSKPSLRRPGNGSSSARSASIRARLRALRRLTTRASTARYASIISKSCEPLSNSASSTAPLQRPVRTLDRLFLVGPHQPEHPVLADPDPLGPTPHLSKASLAGVLCGDAAATDHRPIVVLLPTCSAAWAYLSAWRKAAQGRSLEALKKKWGPKRDDLASGTCVVRGHPPMSLHRGRDGLGDAEYASVPAVDQDGRVVLRRSSRRHAGLDS